MKKHYRKYIEFVCTGCSSSKMVRADYKKKTTLCRTCINKAQEGRQEYYGTRLYYCWQNMKRRCGRPGATGYQEYGAVGISVCEEWLSFDVFKEWALKNGYSDSLTIDRIDGTGNYNPLNCRWATYTVQSRNTKLIHKTNKTGYRGVSIRGDRFLASIQVDKKQVRLGIHDDPLDAAIARDKYVTDNSLEHTLNFMVQ